MKAKKNEMRIIIAGSTAVGKSAVLQLIAKALHEAELSFEISMLKNENPIVVDEWQMERIGAVKNKRKTHIILEERPTYQSIDSTDMRIMGVK